MSEHFSEGFLPVGAELAGSVEKPKVEVTTPARPRWVKVAGIDYAQLLNLSVEQAVCLAGSAWVEMPLVNVLKHSVRC